MSLLSKVFNLSLIAGAVYVAVKVLEKYSDDNPYGVSGKEEKKEAFKKAAAETLEDVKKVYDEKAPEVKDAVNSVTQTVVDQAKSYAPETVAKVQEVAKTVAGAVHDLADKVVGDGISVELSIVRDEDQPEDKSGEKPNEEQPAQVNDGPATVTAEDFVSEQTEAQPAKEEPAEQPVVVPAAPQEPERLEPIVPNKE